MNPADMALELVYLTPVKYTVASTPALASPQNLTVRNANSQAPPELLSQKLLEGSNPPTDI